MDIYEHELNAYRFEIGDMAEKIQRFREDSSCVDNLTHFGLGLSNRALLIVVGLCALVESRLFELAEEEESHHRFKIADLSGQGLTRLQKYLSKSGRVDFGALREWDKFLSVYKIRNAFVHSYGGLIESSLAPKIETALKGLQMDNSLFGRRIRLTSDDMIIIHGIVERLLVELQKV
jgi:hypothetical protein